MNDRMRTSLRQNAQAVIGHSDAASLPALEITAVSRIAAKHFAR